MLNWLFNRTPDFDPAWGEVLTRGVWQYRLLGDQQRERVHAVVARLVARKKWTGGGGFRVTEEMRVVVAGVSALMTLGLDRPFYFPKLKTFILYPTSYDNPEPEKSGGIIPSNSPIFGGGPRLGEAWYAGPVVLSWRAVQRQSRVRGRGRNLVLHEMAHHLDGYDGQVDGTPHFDKRADQRRWYTVTEAEYHRLVGEARRNEVSLLDHYGATNRAEFFAVATECFFERPHAMRARHASLYDLMTRFYHQDPTEWLPADGDAPPSEPTAPRKPPKQKKPVTRFPDLSHLNLSGADELFSHGVLLLNAEDFETAEKVFTEVLKRSPDDGEASACRADARLELGDYAGAKADCAAALEADPDDIPALLTYAAACLATDEDELAEPMIERALSWESDNADALLQQGQIRLRAGDASRAERSLRRAVSLEPFNATAHLWLSDCLDELGRTKRAKMHRERALNLDPTLAD